jgi:hypothetical protein
VAAALGGRQSGGQQLQSADEGISEHESLIWFPAAPGA